MSQPTPFDRSHVEQWSRALVGHQLGLAKLDQPTVRMLEDWTRGEFDPDFNRWRTGASLNHGECARAAALGIPDVAERARASIRQWLRYQLALEAPPADCILLGQWGGTECLSSDYDEKRHWSLAVFLLDAATRGDAGDLELAQHYFTAAAAWYALSAAPTPDDVVHAAGHGGKFYGGPALSPVGGRGNHWGQDEREPIFCLVAGISAEWAENRYPDALPIVRLAAARAPLALPGTAEMVGAAMRGDAGLALAVLKALRLNQPMHFVRWADGSASWIDRQPSRLSPSYMGWVYSSAASRAEVAFPFPPEGRSRGKNADYPTPTCAEVDGHLVTQGGAMQAAPVAMLTEPRLYEVTCGPDGWPAAQEPPGAPISPPTAPPVAPSPPRHASGCLGLLAAAGIAAAWWCA